MATMAAATSRPAACGGGNFYVEPAPAVTLHRPVLRWHWGKVLFELNVMRRWL